MAEQERMYDESEHRRYIGEIDRALRRQDRITARFRAYNDSMLPQPQPLKEDKEAAG